MVVVDCRPADGELVPVPGGVLIRDAHGALVGAVGVSGHLPDQDEECALTGVAAAGLTGVAAAGLTGDPGA